MHQKFFINEATQIKTEDAFLILECQTTKRTTIFFFITFKEI